MQKTCIQTKNRQNSIKIQKNMKAIKTYQYKLKEKNTFTQTKNDKHIQQKHTQKTESPSPSYRAVSQWPPRSMGSLAPSSE